MEEIKDEVAYKLLCNACLCIGHSLQHITNEKLQKLYVDTVKEIPGASVPDTGPKICWLCAAQLKKAVAFIEQVQDSYRILQAYTSESLHECLFSEVVRPFKMLVRHNSPISIAPTTKGLVKDELELEWNDKESKKVLNAKSLLSDDEENESNNERVDKKPKEKKRKYNKTYSRVKKSKNKQQNNVESITECLLTEDFEDNLSTDKKQEDSLSVKDELKDQWNRLCVKDELKVEWSKEPTMNLEDTLRSDNDDVLDIDAEIETFINKVKEKKKKKTKGDNKVKRIKRVVKRLQNGLKNIKSTVKQENQNIITIDLTYEQMLLERERESTADKYVTAAYKCESCLLGFNYKRSYKEHVKSKHSEDIGDYICPICKTIMASVESFTAHYKRHLRRYECNICGKRSTDLKAMQQHYYSSHEISLKRYTCGHCGKVSNSIDTHRYHKDTHKPRVQCTECDKTFTHRAGLLNHRLSVHELNNVFPCTVCDKVFRWKTSLRRHLDKHESKDKSATASCSECGVTFSSVCSYQRHMRNSLKHVTQEQLRFICDHCNRRFADKTKLRDHIEEIHLHKTYQCHICLKPSKNRVGLDQHIRNVHKGRPNNKICHHCGKGFPTKVQLESHFRTHTGERPFICEFCPTTFSQQSNLYKHKRQVHLNMKSKRYPLCKKKKDEKPVDPPAENPVLDPFRPVAVLHYSPDRGFVM